MSFLVPSQCGAANLHSDWAESVGTSALTLITPLAEYATGEEGGFQLLYESTKGPTDEDGRGDSVNDCIDANRKGEKVLCQYKYEHGKAIVFGAGFRHSTEPGRAASSAEPHAFLCLTFGTDRLDKWPEIANRGLRDQSRLLTRPDGSVEETGLGEQAPDNTLDLIRQAMRAGVAR